MFSTFITFGLVYRFVVMPCTKVSLIQNIISKECIRTVLFSRPIWNISILMLGNREQTVIFAQTLLLMWLFCTINCMSSNISNKSSYYYLLSFPLFTVSNYILLHVETVPTKQNQEIILCSIQIWLSSKHGINNK